VRVKCAVLLPSLRRHQQLLSRIGSHQSLAEPLDGDWSMKQDVYDRAAACFLTYKARIRSDLQQFHVKLNSLTKLAATQQACGTNTNNHGQELKRVLARSSCDCSRQCSTTPGCKAFTFSVGKYTTPDYNCYLRKEYGNPADNCGSDCFSGPVAEVCNTGDDDQCLQSTPSWGSRSSCAGSAASRKPLVWRVLLRRLLCRKHHILFELGPGHAPVLPGLLRSLARVRYGRLQCAWGPGHMHLPEDLHGGGCRVLLCRLQHHSERQPWSSFRRRRPLL